MSFRTMAKLCDAQRKGVASTLVLARQAHGGARRRRQRRRHGGGEDVGAGELKQSVDQGRGAGDKRTGDAERLAQCAHQHRDFVLSKTRFGHAASTLRTEHAQT